MASLAVYLNNRHIQNTALKSPEVSIGRHPKRQVVLQDLTVSRHHATLHFIENGAFWTIRNKSAKNPVKLNGHEIVKEEIVVDQDQIAVGACTLIFHEAQPQTVPQSPQPPREQQFNESTEQAV